MTSRHAAGTPAGGRFATEHRSEPSLALGPERPPALVGSAALKERHPAWTTAAVARFLGEPDKTIPNPVIRGRGRMRLFLVSRADSVEQGTEWQQWVADYTRRAAARTPRPRQPRPAMTAYSRTGPYLVDRA